MSWLDRAGLRCLLYTAPALRVVDTFFLLCNLFSDYHSPCCRPYFMLRNFYFLPTGVREEAMDWTMSLRDDFGVNAWTQRAGISLDFLVLLTLFSIPIQADIVLHRDHHFSWKAGNLEYFFSSRHSLRYVLTDLEAEVLSSSSLKQNHCIHYV